MEYVQKICIEREDLNNLLASGHDCTTYLHMSIFFTTILGFSLVGTVLHALSLQKEIDGINQVKKSLMDHITSLEEELTAVYANEQQEAEEEEQEEQEAEEAEDVTDTKQDEELNDLTEDTKPHVD
jgi:sensor histidine kinase YesM